MSESNSPITVSTFLTLYTNSLSSHFDGNLIVLEGFYADLHGQAYRGYYFYDEILSIEKQHKISTQVTKPIKEQLVSGQYYSFEGTVTRSQSFGNDARLNMTFKVSKVLKHKEDLQKVTKVEYDMIRARFDREFPFIHDILLSKIELGKRPALDIITGIQSTSHDDYSGQIVDRAYFQIRHHKCNLSSKVGILEFLNNYDFKDSDLLIILRGGGSGLEVFDDIELCKKTIELPVPFITGIGHDQDKTMLQRVSDMGFSTPTAVGVFLQKIVNTYKTRMQALKEKDLEMERFRKQIERDRLLLTSELNSKKNALLILWIIIAVFFVIVGYFSYLFFIKK
jgi:exodeoxyribonuclease VII large subunit